MSSNITIGNLAFPQTCIRHIFSCYGLLLLNIIFLAVLVFSITDMTYMLVRPTEDTLEMEKLLDGIGSLFVAYGVALEEREFLMKIVKLYPHNKTALETYIDHISHHYGVLLLILGLVVEVAVQLIKIPDRFIDVISFETPVFTIGFICLFVIGYWLIQFSHKLFSAKNSPSPSTEI